MDELIARKFIADLTKNLTCPFCQEIFTSPKTLRCLHSFCLKCLVEWYRECRLNRCHFACPVCAILLDATEAELPKLPSMFGFDPLLKLHQAMTVKPIKKNPNQKLTQKCVGCSKRLTLASFCCQCRGMICSECVNAHKTLKTILGDHETIAFNEFNQKHLDTYLKKQVFCQERTHEDCHLEKFCQTCNKVICQKCIEGRHSKHDLESLQEGVTNVKVAIKRDMQRVKPLIDGYVQDKAVIKDNVERLKEEIQAARKKVHQVVQEQIKALQDHEMTMMIVLDEMLQKELTRDEYDQNELNMNIQQVAEYRQHCQIFQEKEVSLEVLYSYPKLKDICKALSEKSILSNKPVKKAVSLYYVPNVQAIQLLHSLGHIQECVTDPSRCTIESLREVRVGNENTFNVVTRTSEIKVCDTSEGLLEIRIQDSDGRDVEKQVKNTTTGIFSVSYRALKKCPYKVIVGIGGKEISNSPQVVNTLDAGSEFQPVKIIGKDIPTRLHNPCSLALSHKGDIAVADTGNDRIVIFNTNWKFSHTFSGDGDALCRPWGVLFNDDRILVSDNPKDEGRIQEFDNNGTYLRTIYSQKFAEMLGMCATDKQFACLEDGEAARKVKVFDKRTGHLVNDITVDRIHGNPPTFLTWHNGNYYIPFVDNGCVKVFDENAICLSSFGDRGTKAGQFNCVAGITSFGSDMVIVCDAGNDRVQVFTEQGKLVSSFGGRGSDVGLMKAPIHAVITPQGIVMVLECNGSRIQLWK